MIYLFVLLLLVFLSFRYDINGKTKYRDFYYRLMLVVFILVAGLRWRVGIDTPGYLYSFYHDYPSLSDFLWEDYPIGKDPLFVLINAFVKTIGGRFYIVQMIHATIINVLIFKYIKKHSEYLFTCLFFYAIICYTTYNMEIMRGSLSIVICLYANEYVLDKRWIKGYILYFIALLFHVQTIVMFFLPILFFLRFNKLGIIVLTGAFLIGFIVMKVLGDYISLFEANEVLYSKVSSYSESDTYGGQQGNINFIIFHILPLLFYAGVSFLYVKYRSPDPGLLKLEPLILLGVVFMLIRMNLEIAYRYVDYYKIYFVLFFSEFFVKMTQGSRSITKSVAILRAFLVFSPFFFRILVYGYMLPHDYSIRYNPYCSVIDRKVSKKRELMYKRLNAKKPFYPSANINEY